MITEMFSSVIDWYMANINYVSVAVLMTIESSFIPFPSEIVVPPAAWKAAQGELNIILVFVSANLGAMLGAIINYYLAMFLGRPVIYKLAGTRWARLLLITPETVQKAEDYFKKYGRTSTLIGRLVPAVRQLISIPAGISRMNLATFLTYTLIGATAWNAILAAMGYFLYSQKELLERYYKLLSYGFIVLFLVFAVVVAVKIIKGWKKETS